MTNFTSKGFSVLALISPEMSYAKVVLGPDLLS